MRYKIIVIVALLAIGYSSTFLKWKLFQDEIHPGFWETIPHIDVVSTNMMKLDFNTESLLFSTGNSNGTIDIRDASDISKKITIKAHKMRISNLVSSYDGELLASSSSTIDETTKIWNPKNGVNILEIPNTRGPEAFSNDGDIIFMANNSKLFIYDLLNKKFFPAEYKTNGVIESLAVSSDDKYLAVGTTGKVQIWEIKQKHSGLFFWKSLESISIELVSEKTLYGLKNWIQAVAFTKNNRHIVSISRFGGIDIHETPNLTNGKQHQIKRTQVRSVNYIESEEIFLVTSREAVKAGNTRYITSYVKLPSLLYDEENFSFNNKCNSQFSFIFQNPKMALTANVEELFFLDQNGNIKNQSKAINSEGCQLDPSSIPDCDKKLTFVKSPENTVSEDGFTVFYDGQDKVILPVLVQESLDKQKKYGCNKRYDMSPGITRTKVLNQSDKSVTQQQKKNQNQASQQLKLKLDARTLKLNVKGEFFYVERKYDAAYQAFEKAIQLDAYNIRALNNLAIVSLKIGNKNKAIISSHQVIYSLPASPKEKAAALFNMGLACEGTGPIKIQRERRRGASVDRIWYCHQDSLDLYTQSYITFPTKIRADLILKKFTNAKTAENKCKFNDGLYQSYFKRSNKYIFLHENQEPDFLNGLTNEAHGNISHLKKTATGKLTNGLYISTFWSPSAETTTLNNESCEFLTRVQKTHLQDKTHIKPKKISFSKNLDNLANTLIKFGYTECENINYCFNGEWLSQIKFNATQNGIIVTIPHSQMFKRQDVIKELSKIERLLEDGKYIRKMCRESENTWVYGSVVDNCPAI